MAEPWAGGSAAERTQEGASTSSSKYEDAKKGADFLIAQAELFRRLDKVSHKPMRVRQWSVEGLEKTRASVVAKELEILAEARTFGEIREALQDLHIALDNLGIFLAVNVAASVPDEVSQDGSNRSGCIQQILVRQGMLPVDLCDVTIKVVEKNRLGIHVGTFVQGSQGSLNLNLGLTNAIGLAEYLQLTLELGKEPASLLDVFTAEQLMSQIAVGLSRPRIAAQPVNVGLTLHQLTRDNERWSSFQEKLLGGIFTVSSEDGAHAATYELGWRRLTDPSRLASPSVQQQLGHSLKSAIGYTWRHNTFDDPLFPTRGYGLRAQSELAGLWADPKALRYVKQEISAQVAARLGEGVAFTLSGRAGLLLPWGQDFMDRRTPISERFSLGGMSANLRGFYYKGVGQTDLRRPQPSTASQNGEDSVDDPRRAFDSLGGDAFCSVLAALRFQLPRVEVLHNAGIYGHMFLNGGNNILVSGQSKAPRQLWQEFRDTFRWSAGAGLVWPLAVGAIEVSYVRVLKSRSRDEWRHGFHLGCSMDLF